MLNHGVQPDHGSRAALSKGENMRLGRALDAEYSGALGDGSYNERDKGCCQKNPSKGQTQRTGQLIGGGDQRWHLAGAAQITAGGWQGQ